MVQPCQAMLDKDTLVRGEKTGIHLRALRPTIRTVPPSETSVLTCRCPGRCFVVKTVFEVLGLLSIRRLVVLHIIYAYVKRAAAAGLRMLWPAGTRFACFVPAEPELLEELRTDPLPLAALREVKLTSFTFFQRTPNQDLHEISHSRFGFH